MGRREDIPNMYIYDCFVNKYGRKKIVWSWECTMLLAKEKHFKLQYFETVNSQFKKNTQSKLN